MKHIGIYLNAILKTVLEIEVMNVINCVIILANRELWKIVK